ncbi:hypothetical protein K474DRAFT_1667331 [Panus rudis PR-1116 ss-1]|nr:hypothetical protein K474DRAFT_1667331 [Panus rudis PR-1116 ss-1]
MSLPGIPLGTLPLPAGVTLDNTLGALYVGNIVVALLCGVTSFQIYIYFSRGFKDNFILKLTVVTLWVIDVLHVALISHAFYQYTVSNYGNLLALLKVQWGLTAQVVVTDVSDALVRAVFAYRIYILSGKNLLVTALIVFASLVVFVAGLIFSVRCAQVAQFLRFHEISWLIYFSLSAISVADVLISAAMCILLGKQSGGASQRTQSIVRRLMLYSINASALTSVFAIACLIAYATMPNNFVFLAIYVVIPKLYLNSLLAMLNSRKRLREYRSDPVSIPFSGSGSRARTTPFTETGQAVTTRRSTFSGIHIETVTDRKYEEVPLENVQRSPTELKSSNLPVGWQGNSEESMGIAQ